MPKASLKVKPILDRIAVLESKKSKIQDDIKNQTELLREQIRSGGTSGDRIRDFLIAHDTLPPKKNLEEFCNILELFVQERVGQLVLTINAPPLMVRRNVIDGSGDFIGELGGWYNLSEKADLRLGILGGELALDLFDLQKCGFKTKNHAHSADLKSKSELVDGDLFFDFLRYQYFSQSSKELGIPRIFDFRIGDDAVRKWFNNTDEKRQGLIFEMAKLIDRPLPDPMGLEESLLNWRESS